ncbi:amidohydrolase family protein [Rhodococcus sp. NPDC003318]|uniref:amidohydrolase family protein n=1 Tax=Rhodococcus sp. NPDC003318 TaxID=3364503 RepID=UPI0036C6B923
MTRPGDALTEMVAEIGLVDHHCHGIVPTALDRQGFEALLCEADGPGPWHGTLFDTRVGFAVRRLCAPLLDLPVGVEPEKYLARRRALGADEVARRLLRSTGIAAFLVDTGHAADELTTPSELARLAGGSAREVVRLESVAEEVIGTTAPSGFADACRDRLAAAGDAVAFKSIAAYRVGLDLAPQCPTEVEIAASAARWTATLDPGVPVRSADETVTRFLIWTAVDLGVPIQFHTGYGDADADLANCDPLLLTPLLRATAGRGVPIMLLHTYPFHRNAGYLAQVFDHVFVDVGLAMQNVGGRGGQVLSELLELAPFGSVLFSTDGYGLPELFPISTTFFRRALGAVLATGIDDGSWSFGDAERIGHLIGADNARRAYRLGG